MADAAISSLPTASNPLLLTDQFVVVNSGTTSKVSVNRLFPANSHFVNFESDFPVQDASTITLEANREYRIGSAITTAKRFIVQAGARITSIGPFTLMLTYTGVGTMFTSSGVSWQLDSLRYDCPNGTLFDCTGDGVFLLENSQCLSCVNIGNFTAGVASPNTIVLNNSAIFSCTGQGLAFSGNFRTLSVMAFFVASSDAGFKGLDLGTAVFSNLEFNNLEFSGVAGSVAISGLANSGNMTPGSIGVITNSTLNSGSMTPTAGISSSDIRFQFRDNSGVEDTISDALLAITGNVTESVITGIDTPVKVAGTWTIERSSLFSCSTDGRATFIGERPTVVPIDVTSTTQAASGNNHSIHTYIAINGSPIINSGVQEKVSVGDPRNTSNIWQHKFELGDYVEIWFENNSTDVNLILVDGIIRLR